MSSPSSTRPLVPAADAAPRPAGVAAEQLAASLLDIDAIVRRIPAPDFARPLEGIFGGSIGGHVRHCLDHVGALVRGSGAGASTLDYDARERGTAIESDPAAARALIAELRAGLAACAADDLDRSVELTVMLAGDGTRVPLRSTFGREIAFVLNHTIHHQAMIGGMARHLGVDVPAEFGRAPSTIAHDGADACAR